MINESFESGYIIKNNSIVIVSLYNNMYNEYIPQLKELISEFSIKNINSIILDLSKCLFIEKDIWDYFIELKKELQNKNGDLVLINMNGAVKNDYNIMELSNYLESFNDISSAFYNFGILTDIKSA
ncbi:STAS domain-containing protein [uncultured Brachyspira sp.]|uniref:STAS domain-containing protein n=2 Tax=uncultured Brachyspira sp. TaxID=221953 RepID=UPI0025D85F4F|nr:STAS domain-containing protein [uncultured Brachyspira sp.]